MGNSKLQSFVMKTVKRSQIKAADYNPRMISDEAKKRLKKGMKKYGLVQPLIWNERTGVLVSGHQRLSIMDEMEKWPENDYTLEVAAIDVSEKDERTLNVQLNNTSMMGEFDLDVLRDMSAGLDLDDLGFSDSDLDLIFGEGGGEIGEMMTDTPEVTESKDKLDEIKAEREKMNTEKEAENSASFYFIIVCDNEEQRTRLMNAMQVPVFEDFVPADRLKRLVGKQEIIGADAEVDPHSIGGIEVE